MSSEQMDMGEVYVPGVGYKKSTWRGQMQSPTSYSSRYLSTHTTHVLARLTDIPPTSHHSPQPPPHSSRLDQPTAPPLAPIFALLPTSPRPPVPSAPTFTGPPLPPLPSRWSLLVVEAESTSSSHPHLPLRHRSSKPPTRQLSWKFLKVNNCEISPK